MTVTTLNLNTSCEVLWISRDIEDTAAALFARTSSQRIEDLPAVVEQLVNMGALWLAASDGYVTQGNRPFTGENYVDPTRSNSDVVGCSWNKDVSSPAGVFNIQLKPRVRYETMIKPGDVITIFMDDDHRYGPEHRTDGTLITVGIVDSVGFGTAVDGKGAEIHTVSVTGRDLGVIFQKTETIFDRAFSEIEQIFFTSALQTEMTERKVLALSPIEMVLHILDLFFNKKASNSEIAGAQWAVSITDDQGNQELVSLLALINVTTFVQAPMPAYTLIDSLGALEAGNVWNLLQGWSNGIVNELFFDVRDNSREELDYIAFVNNLGSAYVNADDAKRQRAFVEKIHNESIFNASALSSAARSAHDSDSTDAAPVLALVHRQYPYDTKSFLALPSHDIDEVHSYQVQRTNHDVFNFFRTSFPSLDGVLQELMYGTLAEIKSMMRFGIRRMDSESRYPFRSSSVAVSFFNGEGAALPMWAYDYYTNLLATWHAANEQMWAGTVVTRFNPKIRVGHRINVPRAEDGKLFSFYVHGLMHNFSVQPGASRTTLTVVRGVELFADDLPNNLVWNEIGSAIPDDRDWVRYMVTSGSTGVQLKDLEAAQLRKREEAQIYEDIELEPSIDFEDPE